MFNPLWAAYILGATGWTALNGLHLGAQHSSLFRAQDRTPEVSDVPLALALAFCVILDELFGLTWPWFPLL